jgi:hypothetical protein
LAMTPATRLFPSGHQIARERCPQPAINKIQKQCHFACVACPLWVKSGHSALRKGRRYSITSLAVTSSD